MGYENASKKPENCAEGAPISTADRLWWQFGCDENVLVDNAGISFHEAIAAAGGVQIPVWPLGSVSRRVEYHVYRFPDGSVTGVSGSSWAMLCEYQPGIFASPGASGHRFDAK